jgi:hypothetical protein
VRRAALTVLSLLPWLAYAGLVSAAIWLLGFDARPETDATGWLLLALAVPTLFVAVQVSRWERAWIRARFDIELWSRRESGGGGSWLDALWP